MPVKGDECYRSADSRASHSGRTGLDSDAMNQHEEFGLAPQAGRDVPLLEQFLTDLIRPGECGGDAIGQGPRIEMAPSLVDDGIAAGFECVHDALHQVSDGVCKDLRVVTQGILEELHVRPEEASGFVRSDDLEPPPTSAPDAVRPVLAP